MSVRHLLRSSLPFLVSLVLTCVCLFVVAFTFRSGARPSTVLIWMALSFVPYAVCIGCAPSLSRTTSIRLALTIGLLVGVPMLFSEPVLSDDVYRFAWEAKVLAAGDNPYNIAPYDPSLVDLRGPDWSSINNRELTTAYPPLAQSLFLLGHAFGGRAWTFQCLALLLHLSTVVLVTLIARRATFAALALALNPLALVESAHSGHIDIFVGLLLCLGAYSLTKKRFIQAAFAIGAATATKLIGIVLLPLLWRNKPALLLALTLCVAAVVPLAIGDQNQNGFAQYGLRWRGNDSVHSAVEYGVTKSLESTFYSKDGYISLRGADKTRIRTEVIAGSIARFLTFGATLMFAALLFRKKPDPIFVARSTVLVALLLSPQVHPWYLLWLLPLEVMWGGLSGIVWSAAVLVAYVPLEAWIAHRLWVEQPFLRVFEYTTVLLAIAFESRFVDR